MDLKATDMLGRDPLEESWRDGVARMAYMLLEPDFAEGVAFREKRPPVFRDR
jgi:hypothetical protein